MGKSKKNRAASTKQIQHKSQTSAEAFSFGDPVPVLDRRELLDYVECVQMDRWYEPPVSFDGLARTFRAAVHHSSPIAVKCNILTSTYIPHPLLSRHCCKVSDEAAFCLIQRPYISKTLLTRRISPRGSP